MDTPPATDGGEFDQGEGGGGEFVVAWGAAPTRCEFVEEPRPPVAPAAARAAAGRGRLGPVAIREAGPRLLGLAPLAEPSRGGGQPGAALPPGGLCVVRPPRERPLPRASPCLSPRRAGGPRTLALASLCMAPASAAPRASLRRAQRPCLRQRSKRGSQGVAGPSRSGRARQGATAHRLHRRPLSPSWASTRGTPRGLFGRHGALTPPSKAGRASRVLGKLLQFGRLTHDSRSIVFWAAIGESMNPIRADQKLRAERLSVF